MLSDSMISKLQNLTLLMRERASGGAGGARRSRQTGSSAEFSDYREYVPGDDLRRLDWHALARFDKPFLKLFMEEQESAVTVWLDTSASMADKWESAESAAEAVGYLALGAGDRLQTVALREGTPLVSPWWNGRHSYPGLCSFLESCVPSGETDPVKGMRGVERIPRGMSILITDGYGGTEASLDYLRYRKQECCVIQVLSAFETEPDLNGDWKLRDAENGQETRITADRETLRLYQGALERFLNGTRGACRKREAAYMLLNGRKPFEEDFLKALAESGMI